MKEFYIHTNGFNFFLLFLCCLLCSQRFLIKLNLWNLHVPVCLELLILHLTLFSTLLRVVLNNSNKVIARDFVVYRCIILCSRCHWLLECVVLSLFPEWHCWCCRLSYPRIECEAWRYCRSFANLLTQVRVTSTSALAVRKMTPAGTKMKSAVEMLFGLHSDYCVSLLGWWSCGTCAHQYILVELPKKRIKISDFRLSLCNLCHLNS